MCISKPWQYILIWVILIFHSILITGLFIEYHIHTGYNMSEKLNLQWDSFMEHGKELFNELLETEKFSDVTLISDDQHQFRTHKFILSAHSSVFESIIGNNQNNSIIYLRGVKHEELESILQYIYLGEATFYQERVSEFFNTAKDLKIKDIGNNEILDKVSDNEDILVNPETPYNAYNIVKEVTPLNYDEVNNDTSVLKEENVKEEALALREDDEKENEKLKDENCDETSMEGNDRKSFIKDESFYFCTFCDKKFPLYNRKGMKEHIQVQHYNKRYQCDLCEKKFSTKRGLVLHKDTLHHKIKYPCEQCDYKATQPSNLQTHVKSKHQNLKL